MPPMANSLPADRTPASRTLWTGPNLIEPNQTRPATLPVPHLSKIHPTHRSPLPPSRRPFQPKPSSRRTKRSQRSGTQKGQEAATAGNTAAERDAGPPRLGPEDVQTAEAEARAPGRLTAGLTSELPRAGGYANSFFEVHMDSQAEIPRISLKHAQQMRSQINDPVSTHQWSYCRARPHSWLPSTTAALQTRPGCSDVP